MKIKKTEKMKKNLIQKKTPKVIMAYDRNTKLPWPHECPI